MNRNKRQSGQALVALLIFIMMALAIATAASFIIANNSLGATNIQDGMVARQMADSGVETAFLQLLRNGNYTGTGGTPISLNGGTVSVSVTGSAQKTVCSVATYGDIVKGAKAVVNSNNTLVEVSWNEVHLVNGTCQ